MYACMKDKRHENIMPPAPPYDGGGIKIVQNCIYYIEYKAFFAISLSSACCFIIILTARQYYSNISHAAETSLQAGWGISSGY